MKIFTIWLQYAQSYPGELMPNIHDAWDEYAYDENPEGWQESLEKARKIVDDPGSGVESMRVIVLNADESKIIDAFRPAEVDAEVAPETD